MVQRWHAAIAPYNSTMSGISETTPEYQPHIGASRQYVRDVILGVNDGLVSTFLLVSAVVGGGLNATQVLLTGVSGAIAGMISMAIGEYLATKSQEEVLEAEMILEREHLRDHRDHERQQLAEMLGDMGLTGDDLETVVEIIDSNEEAMFGMQAALEFGVVDSERRNPIAAGLASGALFLGGAIPPIIPFLFLDDTGQALMASAVLSGIALFAVGAVKTVATKKNAVLSGLENLALGLIGGVLAYLVGSAFDTVIGS
jgi:VIT1/CCC1 family predicted Fe2+/Mn2+ transporter